MSDTQLVKIDGGRKLVNIGADNGAAILKSNGVPMGFRAFAAAKFGITLVKGMKTNEIKEQALADGATADEFKALRKAYDANHGAFCLASRKVTALFAADPNYRQTVKPTKSGAITTFRYVKPSAAKAGVNAQNAQLKAMLVAAGIALPAELA